MNKIKSKAVVVVYQLRSGIYADVYSRSSINKHSRARIEDCVATSKKNETRFYVLFTCDIFGDSISDEVQEYPKLLSYVTPLGFELKVVESFTPSERLKRHIKFLMFNNLEIDSDRPLSDELDSQSPSSFTYKPSPLKTPRPPRNRSTVANSNQNEKMMVIEEIKTNKEQFMIMMKNELLTMGVDGKRIDDVLSTSIDDVIKETESEISKTTEVETTQEDKIDEECDEGGVLTREPNLDEEMLSNIKMLESIGYLVKGEYRIVGEFAILHKPQCQAYGDILKNRKGMFHYSRDGWMQGITRLSLGDVMKLTV